ncbi:Hsp20/alpha crystallin family protein [Ectobacillus ponti]|uniref:Hsp20/alpha crystallin family protein n=1 Tax=Ectobacillus ponti TaxID=2961894 RepID=A0AA42BV71_9BACI|nr:Hsp20/alpha crystallin family protein [Ectobacillus ponti]MCP8971308.1 Hsp20/alpha crystallin family protein [Ectobacillus ponti]
MAIRDLLLKPVGDTHDLFDSFFREPWFPAITRNMFQVDVKETDKEIVVEAELPGFLKEDIQIQLDDRSIMIVAERKHEMEEQEAAYRRRERQYGKVQRMIPLPADVNLDTAKAAVKDGILTVTLDKKGMADPNRRWIPVE